VRRNLAGGHLRHSSPPRFWTSATVNFLTDVRLRLHDSEPSYLTLAIKAELDKWCVKITLRWCCTRWALHCCLTHLWNIGDNVYNVNWVGNDEIGLGFDINCIWRRYTAYTSTADTNSAAARSPTTISAYQVMIIRWLVIFGCRKEDARKLLNILYLCSSYEHSKVLLFNDWTKSTSRRESFGIT